MRVGRGKEDNLDEVTVGETELGLPVDSSDAAIPGKDMFSSFPSRSVRCVAVGELARLP
jgi:hypothetical protein